MMADRAFDCGSRWDKNGAEIPTSSAGTALASAGNFAVAAPRALADARVMAACFRIELNGNVTRSN